MLKYTLVSAWALVAVSACGPTTTLVSYKDEEIGGTVGQGGSGGKVVTGSGAKAGTGAQAGAAGSGSTTAGSGSSSPTGGTGGDPGLPAGGSGAVGIGGAGGSGGDVQVQVAGTGGTGLGGKSGLGATGGTAGSGGLSSTPGGGTTAKGGSGGVGITGGTGGKIGAGGTSVTSGGGTAGSGGAGGSTMDGPAFLKGPCVAATSAGIVVFARGKNKKIYSKLLPSGTWQALSLDATQLDVRSDLDCFGGSTNSVTLVALRAGSTGPEPVVANGSGTDWNEFVTIPFASGDRAPAAMSGYFVSGSDGRTLYSPTDQSTLFASIVETNGQGVDLSPTSGGLYIASVLNSGNVGVVAWAGAPGATKTFSQLLTAAPPNGQQFSGSPGTCAVAAVAHRTNLVVAVSPQGLWASSMFDGAYESWERLASGSLIASPDCVQRSNAEVHVVALTAAGTVLHVQGSSGSWSSAEDLGVYAP